MNPWALPKDRAIRRLMVGLAERLGPDALIIAAGSQDVAGAVTLLRPGEDEALRAFVFSFGQPAGRYGLHLDFPHPDPAVADRFEGLSLTQLAEVLGMHFDLPDAAAEPELLAG
jgi:hypothetical protein